MTAKRSARDAAEAARGRRSPALTRADTHTPVSVTAGLQHPLSEPLGAPFGYPLFRWKKIFRGFCPATALYSSH